MKGIIFTEFLSFVQAEHGDDLVDDLIHESGMTNADFTSVGTYEFSELAKLLGTYCTVTGVSAPVALRAFGQHLAGVFQSKFGEFYASYQDTFDFLERVEDHIHVEVRKLYPDAQLPTFEVKERSPASICLKYESCRPLSDLAIGLIEGSASYFEQIVTVSTEQSKGDEPHWLLNVRLA